MENEVIKKLNELVAKGFSKTELEIDLGIPKNNLSSYLSGFKKIPPKYNEKILGYNSMTRKELMLINEALTKEVEALKRFIKNTNPILSQNKPVEGNVQQTDDVSKNHTQNSSAAISEQVVDRPKLTQEEIKQKIAELEQLKKDESAKKCPGWMNPRKFILTKEAKIDEINEQINEWKQSLLKNEL